MRHKTHATPTTTTAASCEHAWLPVVATPSSCLLIPAPSSPLPASYSRCCRVIYTNVAHLSHSHKHFLSHNIEFILTLYKVVANVAVVLAVVVAAAYHRQPKTTTIGIWLTLQ